MANTFKRKTSQNVGTSLTSVGSYTVGSATQTTVIGLVIANTTASAITVDCTHYNGTTDTYIVKSAPVPVGGTLVVVGGSQKIVLETGDSIRIKSSASSSIDAIMSILEIA